MGGHHKGIIFYLGQICHDLSPCPVGFHYLDYGKPLIHILSGPNMYPARKRIKADSTITITTTRAITVGLFPRNMDRLIDALQSSRFAHEQRTVHHGRVYQSPFLVCIHIACKQENRRHYGRRLPQIKLDIFLQPWLLSSLGEKSHYSDALHFSTFALVQFTKPWLVWPSYTPPGT